MKKISTWIVLLFILITMISFINFTTHRTVVTSPTLSTSGDTVLTDREFDVGDELVFRNPNQIREEKSIKNYIWMTRRTYADLIRTCDENEGYELIDIEVDKISDTFYFDFILHYTGNTRNAFYRCRIFQNKTESEMRRALRDYNLRIVDLEVLTPINDPRLFAIVKDKESSTGYDFKINQTIHQVSNYKANNPDKRFVDIEYNTQNNANNYHFVTVPNSNDIEWELYLSRDKEEFKDRMEADNHRPIDIEHGSDNNLITAITIKSSSAWAFRTKISKDTINMNIKSRDMRIIDLEHNSDGTYSIVMSNNIVDREHANHSQITSWMQDVIDGGATGVTVSVVKNNSIVYSMGLGYSDKDKGYGMSPYHTTQRWASNSKAAAGAVAAMLDQIGIIDIQNDIISDYTNYDIYDDIVRSTPELIPTFIQLFSHTAGIQHYENGPYDMVPPKRSINSTSNRSMEWAVDYWVEQMRAPPTLDIYDYSTFGPNLGCVGLEKAYKDYTGRTKLFPQLFQELLLDPIGVTGISPDYWGVADPFKTKAYKLIGIIDTNGDDDVSYKLCGGGFKSTSRDLAKYLSIYFSGSPLTSSSLNTIFTNHVLPKGGGIGNPYGLGWNISSSSQARHSGQQPGARNEVWIRHTNGNAVVIMTNTEDLKSSFLTTLRNNLIGLFGL